MVKRIVSIVFLFIVGLVANAQDVHLSQFYTATHLLNPASMGDYEGDYRLIANYRSQWWQVNEPLNTAVVSFDKAFYYYSHEFDIGGVLVNDKLSYFGFVTKKILLAASYEYKLSGHRFRFGFQPGVIIRSNDFSTQTFPNQWYYKGGIFDQNIPNEEPYSGGFTNFDLNVGFQWSKTFSRFTPTAGIALNHINRPKDTYFDVFRERLRSRKVIHGALDYSVSSRIVVQPKLLMTWTAKSNNMVAGANVRYLLASEDNVSLHGGAYFRYGVSRTTDAIIPVVGGSYKNFDLGVSYDSNISSLSFDSERKGVFEISLIYTASSSKPKEVIIPCDRY